MQNLQTQSQIDQLLKWHEGEYGNLLYSSAVKYMEGFIPEYPLVVTQILKSPIFWNWWRFHWEQRDQEFINQCEDLQEEVEIMRDMYYEVHDPRTLVTAIYMSGQVLEGSYAKMINDLTDAQFERKEVLA